MRNSIAVTKQILLLTSVLLLWACGDTPLDYVDLSEYQAVENAAEDAWQDSIAKVENARQDSITKYQEASRKALQSLTTFTDSRDGQVYKQVTIGKQTWMAENLNYNTEISWCVGEYSETKKGDCDKYGRLYTWDAAMEACPKGWHLPSFEEWDVLLTTVGGQLTAGEVLKSTSGWHNNGNGIDAFGFSVLPAGVRIAHGSYYDEFGDSFYVYGGDGASTSFWCSTDESYYAYYMYLNYDYEYIDSGNNDRKDNGYSVRCLKDDASGVSAKSSSSMKKYSSSSVVKMSSSVAKSSSSFIVKSSSSVKIASSSSVKITSLSSSREQLKSSSSKVTPSSSSKKVVLSSSSTKQSSSSIDLDYYNRQMQGQKGSGLSWKASDGPYVQINRDGVKTDWYYWTDSENGGTSGFNRGSVPNIADDKGSGKYTAKEVESIGGVGGKAVLGPSFMMKDSVFHVGSVQSGFSGGSIKLPADKMLGLCLEYTNTFDYFVIQIIYDNDEANNWGRPEFHLPIATEKKIINLPWAVFQKISDWAFADISVYDAIKVMKGVNFQAINNSSKEVFGEFVISKIGAYGTCGD